MIARRKAREKIGLFRCKIDENALFFMQKKFLFRTQGGASAPPLAPLADAHESRDPRG